MKPPTRKTVIRISLLVLALVAAGLIVVKLAFPKDKLPEVETTVMESGAVTSTVAADGELKALNQVEISAEVVAKIKKIYVQEGDAVTKGQLLCTLEDGDLRSERSLYLSQLEQAKAAYIRGKSLFEENLLSAADYEERRTAYEVARARVAQSNENLSKTRIYAPLAGRVVAVNVEEGETAVMGTMNNSGTVMFTLGDLSGMEAEIYVDEADVKTVAVGQPAVVTLDADENAKYKATVASISYMPSSETASTSTGSDVVEFKVTLSLREFDKYVRPGMSASAEITTASHAGVLACPIQALGKQDLGGKSIDTVFVLAGGRAKTVPVTTGISDGVNIEITSGLKAGDVVIAGPYDILRTLHDGDQVKVAASEGGKGKKWPSGKMGGKPPMSPARAAKMMGGRR